MGGIFSELLKLLDILYFICYNLINKRKGYTINKTKKGRFKMTKEKILQLLDDKVNEVFFEMQQELKIEDGNIFPLDHLELNYCICALADKIECILNTQK